VRDESTFLDDPFFDDIHYSFSGFIAIILVLDTSLLSFLKSNPSNMGRGFKYQVLTCPPVFNKFSCSSKHSMDQTTPQYAEVQGGDCFPCQQQKWHCVSFFLSLRGVCHQ
jgi:hypothetical protein